MDSEWNDGQPIHRQLRDRLVSLILDGAVQEGEALPSVRTAAAEYRINPLTAMKGFQHLVDEQLVEVRRGLGMFVLAGARERLRNDERRRFLTEEWPRIHDTVRRLGLSAEDLLGTKPAEKKRHVARD